MSDPQIISTLKAKRHDIEATIKLYDGKLVQAKRDLAHVNATLAIFASDDPGEIRAYTDTSRLGEGHFAASEDRARRDGKLVSAGPTLELATAFHVVVLETTAAGADRGAISLGPAHTAERGVSGVLTSFINGG